MRASGQVRIIGGRWRRRRLRFPGVRDLRPTPDRVKETLFNWLGPRVDGARCLDLFAGSGSLGFEAASRGAERVVLVERNRDAALQLRTNAATLGAGQVEVVESDALGWLNRPGQPFDIVFLDPPYAFGDPALLCARLAAGGWVAPGGRVYIETAAVGVPDLPDGWALLRSEKAGQVRYHLASPNPD